MRLLIALFFLASANAVCLAEDSLAIPRAADAVRFTRQWRSANGYGPPSKSKAWEAKPVPTN